MQGAAAAAAAAILGRSGRGLSSLRAVRADRGAASSSFSPLQRSSPPSPPSPRLDVWWRFARRLSSGAGDEPPPPPPPSEEGDSLSEEKPVRRKKLSKKERFGRYDQDFEDEMQEIPVDETIEHLYDARPIVEEWMGHPTFYDMISADAYPKKGAPKDEPPGEGPILRWQTRVVLSPGGDAFHPKNRKVKVSVYVKELGLSPIQKERLLFMVGKRYNPNRDELTIVSERFDQREENRKDVLRTLLALIEEAEKEDSDDVEKEQLT